MPSILYIWKNSDDPFVIVHPQLVSYSHSEAIRKSFVSSQDVDTTFDIKAESPSIWLTFLFVINLDYVLRTSLGEPHLWFTLSLSCTILYFAISLWYCLCRWPTIIVHAITNATVPLHNLENANRIHPLQSPSLNTDCLRVINKIHWIL